MRNLLPIFIILFETVNVSIFSQTTGSWSLTGNAATTSSNFLGTTDNKPLIFRINNNTTAGLIDVVEDNGGKNNVALGHLSLDYLTKNLSLTGTGNSKVNASIPDLSHRKSKKQPKASVMISAVSTWMKKAYMPCAIRNLPFPW